MSSTFAECDLLQLHQAHMAVVHQPKFAMPGTEVWLSGACPLNIQCINMKMRQRRRVNAPTSRMPMLHAKTKKVS